MKNLLAGLLIGSVALCAFPDGAAAQLPASVARAPDAPRQTTIVAPPVRTDSVEVDDSREGVRRPERSREGRQGS